jgi:hypothetical protein
LSFVSAVLALAVAVPAGAGAPSCSATPLTGCRVTTVPTQSRLWLNNRPGNQRDTIVWKQRRSAANTTADFGNPVDAHGYALCMYNSGGSLIFRGTIPSGGTCGGHPCWRTAAAGYHYRNGRATPDGLTKVLLRAGDAGHTSVVVKGRGASLGLPALPLTLPLTIQLQEESGPCWASTFESARRNDAASFRASAAH